MSSVQRGNTLKCERCQAPAVVDVHNLHRDEHLVLCMGCFVKQMHKWLETPGSFFVTAAAFGRNH